MVTQCTACLIWFKVTREQLHAAHGLVRCSACNTVFNALATLRHDMPEGAVLGGSTSAVREETASDSGMPSARESGASEIDGNEEPEPGEQPEEQDRESGRSGDDWQEPGDGGLQRIEPYLGMPPDESALESERRSGLEVEPEQSLPEEFDSRVSTREEFNELDLYMASALDEEDLQEVVSGARDETESPEFDEGPPPAQEEPIDAGGDHLEPETREEFARQDLDGETHDNETPPGFALERGKRWQRRIWGLVLGLAALALAGQIVYAQRDALGRMFGLPRSEPMLNQYAITGATLDAARQPGALVLKGVLVNHGSRGQPMPLIRVTLTDRYGDTVGARILSPGQYGAGGKSLLQAHQRFMFHVKLADPGSSAVGFSLVLCKHHGHSILCQDS
ncbi:MAG TPA: zinc-ribbon and DUF3426 domain-containing protein [Gammaproteobacteria bacterium]|nr:zinc-ribbon and DUF3426 domain-containing protein [Gammaproteobacteria bacterium]